MHRKLMIYQPQYMHEERNTFLVVPSLALLPNYE